MFGAPKKRGWYCMSCDTSNKSKNDHCSNCNKLRDGKMFEPDSKANVISDGEELTSDQIYKKYREEGTK